MCDVRGAHVVGVQAYYLLKIKIWASEKSTDLSRPDLDPTPDLRPKAVPQVQNSVSQHACLDHWPSGSLVGDQAGLEHHIGEKEDFERVGCTVSTTNKKS